MNESTTKSMLGIDERTGRPEGHDRYGEIVGYDPEVVQRLIREDGLDEATAIIVASCEMDGAPETEAGGIRSKQTACHLLDFNEALPESAGAEEGEAVTHAALRNYITEVLAGGPDVKSLASSSQLEKKTVQPTSFADFLKKAYPNLDEGALTLEDFDRLTDLWLAYHDPESTIVKNDFIEEVD